MLEPEEMRSRVSPAAWRNRFILVNLGTIGGAALTFFSLVLWQTDYVVHGGSVLGFPLALLGLVISFFAPRVMARWWKKGDSR